MTATTMRWLTLLTVSAGIIVAAALAMCSTANATATSGQGPSGPGYSYSPTVKAKPAPTQLPGWHNHHGPRHIANLTQR